MQKSLKLSKQEIQKELDFLDLESIEICVKRNLNSTKLNNLFKKYPEQLALTNPGKFARICSALLTPQSYGAKLEKIIMIRMGGTKNKPKDKCGDFCVDKENYECKVSIITPTNISFNMVQIRPDHNIQYYIVAGWDIRNNICSEYVFKLTTEQIEKEMIELVAANAHGYGKKQQEKRMGLPLDSNNKNFNRWLKLYKITL